MSVLVEVVAVVAAVPLLVGRLRRGITIRIRMRPRLIPGGYAMASVVVLIVALAAVKP